MMGNRWTVLIGPVTAGGWIISSLDTSNVFPELKLPWILSTDIKIAPAMCNAPVLTLEFP